MLQLIGLLAISWLIIWLFEKGNLSVLGLLPTKERMKFFIILFIASSVFSASTFLLKMYFAKETYTISQSLSFKTFLVEVWHQFRTVFTEELLCRGAILYVLIRKIGKSKAIVISSAFFCNIALVKRRRLGKYNANDNSLRFHFCNGTFASIFLCQNLLSTHSFCNTFWLELDAKLYFPRN